MAERGSLVLVGMTGNDGIEALAVVGGHILHVVDALEPPLNLERHGAGLDELFEMVALVEVLQREQMALTLDDTAVGIDKVELHAAELGTLTAIGAAPETMLGGIAQTAIADAEGSVDKDLELYVGHLTMDFGYLGYRQLAGKHHTAKTQRAQPAHFLGRAVVGLRRSVERKRSIEQPHVLNEHGIDVGRCQLGKQLAGGAELCVEDNGVDRDIDLDPKLMGIAAQLMDVVDTVARRGTCTEARRTDVDGIGTMVDGRHSALQVLGGGQKLKTCHHSILLMSNGVS